MGVLPSLLAAESDTTIATLFDILEERAAHAEQQRRSRR